MKWDHEGVNLYPLVSLSDCQVSRITFKENEIIVLFENGVVVSEGQSKNYVETEKAKIVLSVLEESTEAYKVPYGQSDYPNILFLDFPICSLEKEINEKEIKCTVVEEFYSINGAIFKIFYEKGTQLGWIYMRTNFEKITYYWIEK